MMQTLACRNDQRRLDARAKGLNGIDSVEVSHDQRVLTVYFLLEAPKGLTCAHVEIAGGTRVRGIRAVAVNYCHPENAKMPNHVEVVVDRLGDFSTYTLLIRDVAGFDPCFAACEFSFKAHCAADLDCKTAHSLPAMVFSTPQIDYLAKDYASFRRLLMDRLSLVMPGWKETHVPDVGVAVVEVLAYVGDYLSYYQDAVATEAYLNTARTRISVRRHARLVDYRIHEGCNARTWVSIDSASDWAALDPRKVFFVTDLGRGDSASVISADSIHELPSSNHEVFEPVFTDPITILAAHSQISLYTWGGRDFALSTGATACTLVDSWDTPAEVGPDVDGDVKCGPSGIHAKPRVLGNLKAGSFLLFEEVRSSVTGEAADADHSRRHVVRLTRVTPVIDPVYDQPVVNIEWSMADALPFSITIAVPGSEPEPEPEPENRQFGPTGDAATRTDLTVARANLLLVDHGRRVENEDVGCVPRWVVTQQQSHMDEKTQASGTRRRRFTATLKKRPLVFRQPIAADAPAANVAMQTPQSAAPQINLISIPGRGEGAEPLFSFDDLVDPTRLALTLIADTVTDIASCAELLSYLPTPTQKSLKTWDGSVPMPSELRSSVIATLNSLLQHWIPVPDLFDSSRDDLHFVVEMDDAGQAHLRFGDDELGKMPTPGTQFRATYRVGAGASGNLGAESLTTLVLRDLSVSGAGTRITNPLAAHGGSAPESLAQIKTRAPVAFREKIERAITAQDYARLAEEHPAVQRAAAQLDWDGSRYVVSIAIDVFAGQLVSNALLDDVRTRIARYRRIGHEVEIVAAAHVSLDVVMQVHLLPHVLRADVKSSLTDIFGTGVLANGDRGVFHPDSWTFGDRVYASRLVTVAQSVAGVESVKLVKFERLFEGPNQELEDGVIPIKAFEIARLDNDPNFPEHGRIKFEVKGGL